MNTILVSLNTLQRCAEFFRTRVHPVIVFAALLMVAIWAMLADFIMADYRFNEANRSAEAINLAAAFEQHTAHTFSEFDNFLIFARDLHETKSLPWSTIVTSSYAVVKNSSYLHYLSVTNAAGDIVASTLDFVSDSPVSMADRESFIFQKETTNDRLFISKPVFGRLAKQWVVHLTRPLRKPNGEFDGIIAIILPVASMTQAYDKLSLGEGGGVALVGDDGIFRAGTAGFQARLGQSYREPKVIDPAVPAIELPGRGNSRLEKQVFDGRARLVAYRHLSQYPLRIMIARAEETDQELFQRYLPHVAVAGLITLLLIATAAGLQRAQEQARRSLEQRNSMEVEKKVAEANAVDRSLFLAVMSHEIRTPLNGVLGALDLIKRDDLDLRSQRCVGMATESGETLLKLIDDILLFSKFDQNHIDLTQEPFVLKDLCESVHKSLLSLTITSKNRFELSMCSDAKQAVVGDAHRLRQVLVNLVGNANKFTKKGRIVLKVETLPGRAGTLTVRLSIKDTGIGIPKEMQKMIFNRFQTLDPSYSRRTDGTGLGLAISDKLVRAMGNEIKLESEPGAGSCFSFELTLPLSAQNLERAPESQQRRAGLGATPLRILLAEDNPTNTYVASELLSDAGHTVRHASNGRKAVDLANLEEFDIILMDISMPEMDGLQAAAAIRSSKSRNAAIPIIALTAHVGMDDQETFLSAGIDGYLTKPVRRDVLLQAIAEHVMQGKRPGAQSPAKVSAEQAVSGEHSVVDFATLSEFVRDRPVDRALKTVQIFVDELRHKVDTLEAIIKRDSKEELQFLAHSNIGSGAMLGAVRLVDISRAIEAGCLEGAVSCSSDGNILLGIMRETVAVFSAVKNEATLETFLVAKRLAA